LSLTPQHLRSVGGRDMFLQSCRFSQYSKSTAKIGHVLCSGFAQRSCTNVRWSLLGYSEKQLNGTKVVTESDMGALLLFETRSERVDVPVCDLYLSINDVLMSVGLVGVRRYKTPNECTFLQSTTHFALCESPKHHRSSFMGQEICASFERVPWRSDVCSSLPPKNPWESFHDSGIVVISAAELDNNLEISNSLRGMSAALFVPLKSERSRCHVWLVCLPFSVVTSRAQCSTAYILAFSVTLVGVSYKSLQCAPVFLQHISPLLPSSKPALNQYMSVPALLSFRKVYETAICLLCSLLQNVKPPLQ
jgi:hypothetical protein